MMRVARLVARHDGSATAVGASALQAAARVGPHIPIVLAVASATLVAIRVVPDITTQPVGAEEAIAGLVSSRPIGEALATAVWERGGAPLHVLIAHLALAVDGSVEALRALSAIFAVATVLVCFDLGRRLAGPVAGAVAAAVAAASTLLGIYGSYGRMYALFAFTAALATDMFLRSLQVRTGRAALVAALAAWLLAATHPYGIVVALVEGVVALVLWRGRPLRPAVPTLLVGLAIVGWLAGAWRLADRFDVGVAGSESLASLGRVWSLSVDAFASFAGGSGVWLVAFGALAVVGIVAIAAREPAFAAFAVAATVAIPILLVVGRAPSSIETLSPRHFAFALPFVAAAVGVGVSAIAGPRRTLGVAMAGAVAALAVAAPLGGLQDPRTSDPHTAATGARDALAGPAEWVRREVAAPDVLFPYSPVYLAAPDSVEEATIINRDEPVGVLRALDRVDPPVRRVVLAVPAGAVRAPTDALRRRLPGASVIVYPQWLLIAFAGPFEDDREVVEALYDGIQALRAELRDKPLRLATFLRRSATGLGGALERLAQPPR